MGVYGNDASIEENRKTSAEWKDKELWVAEENRNRIYSIINEFTCNSNHGQKLEQKKVRDLVGVDNHSLFPIVKWKKDDENVCERELYYS